MHRRLCPWEQERTSHSSQQPWGFLPFFIGWIVAGFGVVGQPHIIIRAMAIDSAKNINFARNIKFSSDI